jgi:predicted TIM-barrel fold metal-dependent hydrolase
VSCKLSGLCVADRPWTLEENGPLILETIDTFGVDRCMFASNFPVDKLFSSYDAIFDAFKAITEGYSTSERTALFHDNAARFHRH